MYPPPALRTSQTEFLGSTIGIVLVAVVALVGLAIFIGLVYWAGSHPGPRIVEQQRRRREMEQRALRREVPERTAGHSG